MLGHRRLSIDRSIESSEAKRTILTIAASPQLSVYALNFARLILSAGPIVEQR